jgi:hypothetical protein
LELCVIETASDIEAELKVKREEFTPDLKYQTLMPFFLQLMEAGMLTKLETYNYTGTEGAQRCIDGKRIRVSYKKEMGIEDGGRKDTRSLRRLLLL